MSDKPQLEQSEALDLLRRIDGRLDVMQADLANVERRAIRHGAGAGAVAGALTGGVVTVGVLLARIKLGL